MQWLLRRFFLKDGADTDEERAEDHSPALSVLNFVLLTVRMWDLPEIRIKQKEEKDRAEANFPGITADLEQILNRVRLYCPDTQAAISYAQELSECIRHWKPVQPEQTKTEKPEKDCQQDNAEKSLEQEASDNSSKEHSEVNENLHDGQFSHQKSNEDTGERERSDSDQGAETHKDLFHLSAEELPSTIGTIIAEELQAHKEDNEFECLAVAYEESVTLQPLSEEDRQNALRASNALKIRLQGLLQSAVSKPSYLSRRGRLNTHSLYRLKTGNPSVFMKEEERQGISTAVHLLLDASGSMSGKKMQLASLACYAVAKALETIQGISVGVSFFPASSDSYNIGSIVRHGERVNDRFAVEAQGTTPLAEALWWTLQTLGRRKETRKIVLILTDGRPHSLEAAERAIGSILKCGFEPFGIGILDSNIEELLSDRSEVISTLDDLAPAMFRILQQNLIGGAHGRSN